MSEFYTILTDYGAAEEAAAHATGTQVQLAQIAVGDGNGNYHAPLPKQTALVNEVWRGNINDLKVDAKNPKWVVAEIEIPPNVGGWTIRELGLIDSKGGLVAVCKYPETYKPRMDSGAAKEIYIRMVTAFSNVDSIELTIDPAVVLATRELVEKEVQRVLGELFAHAEDKENPHAVSCTQIGAATKSILDSHKAAKNNPHGVTAAQVGAVARQEWEELVPGKVWRRPDGIIEEYLYLPLHSSPAEFLLPFAFPHKALHISVTDIGGGTLDLSGWFPSNSMVRIWRANTSGSPIPDSLQTNVWVYAVGR